MVMAAISIRPGSGPEVLTAVFELWPEYGDTAELAHEVLTLCLTAVTNPVLVDSDGCIQRIPRGRLVRITVWEDQKRAPASD